MKKFSSKENDERCNNNYNAIDNIFIENYIPILTKRTLHLPDIFTLYTKTSHKYCTTQ